MTQDEALKALEWLMSDRQEDRRTGRSTVEAVALLRHALHGRGGRALQVALLDPRDQQEAKHQRRTLFEVATRLGIALEPAGPSSFKLVYPVSKEAIALLLADPFPWSILNNGSPLASRLERPRRTRAQRLLADEFKSSSGSGHSP